MEEKLYRQLRLKEGARVLDASVGSSYVALSIVHIGLRFQRINITAYYLRDVKKNIRAAKNLLARMKQLVTNPAIPYVSIEKIVTLCG